MAPLVDPEHLLDLRLRLQHEVLGASATHDEHAALTAGTLGLEHDAGGLVHVRAHVEAKLAPGQRLLGHVHADRAVAGRAGVDRHLELVRRGQNRAPGEAERLLTLAHVAAQQIVILGRAHRALELLPRAHLADELVGREQDTVVEEDVVDPDDALVAQLDVVGGRGPAVHGEAECEMGVVIQVRTGRNDPVDEARLHERDEAAHPEPGRRHRARERHADRGVRLEHALGEELAALAEPARVVGQEGVVDERGGGLLAGDRGRIDALATEVRVGRSRHRVILSQAGRT